MGRNGSAKRRIGVSASGRNGSADRRVGEREKRVGEVRGERTGEADQRIALRSQIVIVLGFSGWSFFWFG